MASSLSRCAGIVLCGGHSRRMGVAKPLLPFGTESMLARVVRLLREAVSPVVVVAAADQELPPLPEGVRIVRDCHPDRGRWKAWPLDWQRLMKPTARLHSSVAAMSRC